MPFISGGLIALIIAAAAATQITSGVLENQNIAKANEENKKLQQETNQANIAMQNSANAASALEAQKNRDFQEYMSSTAHQREVKDLEAAGLNKWLSVNGGGASTPSGAVASQNATRANSAKVVPLGDYGLGHLSSMLQSIAFISAIEGFHGNTAATVHKNGRVGWREKRRIAREEAAKPSWEELLKELGY